MKKVMMECALFYEENTPSSVNLLLVNDMTNSFSIVKADSKVITELDPCILSHKLMSALINGLKNAGYTEVENKYEL